MSMVLSHETALEMYRSSLMPFSKPQRIPFHRIAFPAPDDAAIFHSLPVRTSHLPLHCVVPESRNRRGVKEGHCHVHHGDMNTIRLRQNTGESLLCVVPPEVLFIQMAAKLSLVALVKLGYELCGSYSLPMSQPQYTGTPRGFNRRRPITSVAKLEASVELAARSRSVKNARSAMRYIVDGAATPQEAELCMLMVLPRRLGGYGLERPRISHSGNSRRLSPFLPGNSSCDFLWSEAGVAVEYRDKRMDDEEEGKKSSKKRKSPLDEMGVAVISLTSKQVMHVCELDGIADSVARKHGRYLRRDLRYDYASRQADLREQVLSVNW